MALPKTTPDRVKRMAELIRGADCCGIAEFSGLEAIESAGDAVAIRKAAYVVGNRGIVVVTVPDSLTRFTAWLREAGFDPVKKFVNPRTHNPITLMVADSIKNKIKSNAYYG